MSSHVLCGLARHGHTIHAAAPTTEEKLKSGDKFAEDHPEINLERIIVPYFATSPDFLSPKKYRKTEGRQIREILTAKISGEKPDVMIIGRESFAWYVPDISLANSIPSVLLIQGGTTHGILQRTIPGKTAQELLEHFRKVTLIISVARHLISPLQKFGLQNIKVIQNAIDTRQFYPRPKDSGLLRELGILKEDTVIAHISNLKILKRPMDIIDSAQIALRRNSTLRYLIIGDGPLRQTMEEACRKYNISNRFIFLGWIDHPSVPGYLNLADVVVMPSEAEGLPLVYLEAQACGKLLLSSDIPAASEVIVPGETGLLFRKGDIQDMTDKILLAAGNPGLREEMGQKARLSLKNDSLEDMVNLYEDALRETVTQFRAS